MQRQEFPNVILVWRGGTPYITLDRRGIFPDTDHGVSLPCFITEYFISVSQSYAQNPNYLLSAHWLLYCKMLQESLQTVFTHSPFTTILPRPYLRIVVIYLSLSPKSEAGGAKHSTKKISLSVSRTGKDFPQGRARSVESLICTTSGVPNYISHKGIDAKKSVKWDRGSGPLVQSRSRPTDVMQDRFLDEIMSDPICEEIQPVHLYTKPNTQAPPMLAVVTRWLSSAAVRFRIDLMLASA